MYEVPETDDLVLTTEMRRAFLSSLPYVKRLPERHQCDDYRWGSIPLYAIYGTEEQRAKKENWRCRNPAWWSFKGLKLRHKNAFPSSARDGVYCMSHLYSQFNHNDKELERLVRYWKKWKEKQCQPV